MRINMEEQTQVPEAQERVQEIETSWHSYPKLFQLGHRAIIDIFQGPVIVEEKVDGSQISFGTFKGELRIKSKSAMIVNDFPDKMFTKAVTLIKELQPLLTEGWTYRGEYLQKPKHNALAYDRTPNNHIVIFDICTGHEKYLNRADREVEAKRLGFEPVPVIFEGTVTDRGVFLAMLDTLSFLGGCKVEGVVIKNHAKFNLMDGKVAMAKFVSEAFKEIHNADWKESHPGSGDIVNRIIDSYRTPARWQKAVQHLRDAGNLPEGPQAIGPLMKEVGQDILAECKADIIDKLFEHAWPSIQRGVTAGLPEWYKEKLMEGAFQAIPVEAPNVVDHN